MGASTGLLLERRRRVAVPGVEDQIGAQALGEGELFVIYVDGANLKTHDLGVLNGQVSQPSSA